MSRLGDLIQMERARRKLSAKNVAKNNGISEKFLLEVESGKRIIQDEQARRILRSMGLTEHNEVDFSLDEIAATVDLATLSPTRPAQEAPAASPARPAPQTQAVGGDSGIWLDALAGVLKSVPVYNAVWKVVGRRLMAIQNGRIEGGSPEKVLYFLTPDDSMAGFRLRAGDLALVLPSASPIEGTLMLVEWRGQRMLRRIKVLSTSQVLLQSYDREYREETAGLADLHFLGRVARVEFSIAYE